MSISLWIQGRPFLAFLLDVLGLIYTWLDRIQRNLPQICLLPFTSLSHSSKNLSLHYQRDSHIMSTQLYVFSLSFFQALCTVRIWIVLILWTFPLLDFCFPKGGLVQLSVDISIVLSAARWSWDRGMLWYVASNLQKEVIAAASFSVWDSRGVVSINNSLLRAKWKWHIIKHILILRYRHPTLHQLATGLWRESPTAALGLSGSSRNPLHLQMHKLKRFQLLFNARWAYFRVLRYS